MRGGVTQTRITLGNPMTARFLIDMTVASMLLIPAILPSQSRAQTDLERVASANLNGAWHGDAALVDKELKYEWSIEQNGDRLSGSVTLWDESEMASYHFEGELRGDRVMFRGTRWLSPKLGSWCMASGELRIVTQRDSVELRGRWSPNAADRCPNGPSGEVYLRRK
jgi:hypothetical protein